MPILNGSLDDWSAQDRLDTAATGVDGYALFGATDPDYFYFAVASELGPVGTGTTLWLDTDLDRATGYQIWGWTGGIEYHVEVGADNVPRLYETAAGGTLVGDIDYVYSADSGVLEFRIARADIGSPDRVRVFADVNNEVFIPNSYGEIDLIVSDATPVVSAGGKTLDGSLDEWSANTRLDSPADGVEGYALYGDRQDGVYTIAISTDGLAIGANTTIWLDTDLDTSTGYLVWGWAVGAEYNVNFGADGIARLYSGAAGAALVGEISYRLSADKSVLELAIDGGQIGTPDALRVFADVNDTVFLPNDYSQANYVIGASEAVTVGTTTLDGSVGSGEWTASELLYESSPGGAGYQLYGAVEADTALGDLFVLAIASDLAAIGTGTTIWLDTDLDTSTGYQIWGWAGGAEYNINISADGVARLYTGGAGETFVGNLEFSLGSDGSGFEVALPKALLTGSPDAIRVLADVNDAIFLPGAYAGANLVVRDEVPPVQQEDDPTLRIAIVYSETTAANYYNITNYGQLFMSAQNQATQAGIPFDLLDEGDLLDPDSLAEYDAIVFPAFSHVRASQVDAIAASLEAAATQYGVGLIAAGNFLTNDETGAALPGNSYARMATLLGVTLEGFGQTLGVDLVATGAAHPILDTYSDGQVVGAYSNASYLHFTDVTGAGQVLFEQEVTGGTGGTEVHDAVIATEIAGRNVHFATDALLGNNNILGEALNWVAKDNAPDVSLLMTRGSSLFYSRNDMDQSQETWDVIYQDPGIYDEMLPIIEDWYDTWGFVGSYYINIGAYSPDQATDWSISKPYFDEILALESEIGSHSYTHPHDTNLLLPDQITEELLDARILAYSDLVDHGVLCWCPYCMRDDASEEVLEALSEMDASEINAMLADTLARTDPGNPDAVDASELTEVERAVLEASYRFQFEYSKLIIEREMGINVSGAAVPGAPESVDTTREIIQYYDYLSGGYSGIGAGYPGAFGYLTPGETERVYLAPNMSFDFSLIGFQGLSPGQAAAVWLEEYDEITSNATAPIIAFPWHDYGPTNWDLGEPDQVYSLQMFETIIGKAAADGTEFVTGEDLAQRIESFGDSAISATRDGNVVSVTVDSPDAGHFALDMGSEGSIASVANWYAYDDDSVFLPKAGGTFEITLGNTPADVTHVTDLGQRNSLVSLSGDGTDLAFVVDGHSDVHVDLKTNAGSRVAITGAADASFDGDDDLVLAFSGGGRHSVNVDVSNGSSEMRGGSGRDILIGGENDDRMTGGSGDDLMIGRGAFDTFVFGVGSDDDVVRDFVSGTDALEFVGLGYADAAEALSGFVSVSEGARLTFDDGGSVTLAGLSATDLDVVDIIINDSLAFV